MNNFYNPLLLKNKMKKKSKQRNRKVKITNTHLEGIDLTKDYEVEKK